MPPEPWTSPGLLGIYILGMTCSMLQMNTLTCFTMVAQRPGNNAFKSGLGNFRQHSFCPDGGYSVPKISVAAEADVQCCESDEQASLVVRLSS